MPRKSMNQQWRDAYARAEKEYEEYCRNNDLEECNASARAYDAWVKAGRPAPAGTENDVVYEDDEIVPIPTTVSKDSTRTQFWSNEPWPFKTVNMKVEMVQYGDVFLDLSHCRDDGMAYPIFLLKATRKAYRNENHISVDVVRCRLDGRECPEIGPDGEFIVELPYSRPKGWEVRLVRSNGR